MLSILIIHYCFFLLEQLLSEKRSQILENGVSVISRAAQVRQFGEFVDTHVVSGRCLEIFVRNRLTGSLVGGAVNITQETLASKCLSAPKKKKEFPVSPCKQCALLSE